MKRSHYKSYFAAGVTAFCVIAAAILMFFLIYHILCHLIKKRSVLSIDRKHQRSPGEWLR